MSDAADKESSRYASRKFLLALLVITIGTGMAIWGDLKPELLVDLMKWTVGLYFGFNVTQKAAEWIASKVSL